MKSICGDVPEWAEIEEEIRITNVDRLLLAYLKCPVDNRRSESIYGVPVTYGSEKIIKDIKECLEQVKKEYKLKEAFVGVDQYLFGKDNKLPKDGLFKLIETGVDDFWAVFDPAIRDSAYSTRLLSLFELLEKSVGTSKGILTEPVTQGATATEIKRSSYDTYALVENMRANWVKAVDQLVYAFDVLCDYYHLTPPAEYTVNWDWSYSLIESSQETWNQTVQAASMGAIKLERLNMYVTGQTIEEAEEEIKEINDQSAGIEYDDR